MFVGLVRDPRWEPPEGEPDHRTWEIPWRAIAYVVGFCVMLRLVSTIDHALGPVAGYASLCVLLALAAWRFDRWMSRQNWRGMKDYQA